MKNFAPLLSILLLAPLGYAQGSLLPPDCRYSDGGRDLQILYGYLSDMEHFEGAYQAARAGSFEEQRAIAARNQAGQYALSLADQSVLQGYAHSQLDVLQVTMEQKYQAARANGYPESIYRSVLGLALTAFEQKGLENIQCLYGDIRTIDSYGRTYESLYQAARANSRIEGIYARLRTAVFAQSEKELGWALPRMSGGELDQLEREYAAIFQSAPAGSRLEFHARIIRDTLRREILNRGSYPIPMPPVPHPVPVPRPVPVPGRVCPPGTVYKPSIGRCVAAPRRVR